MDKINIEIGKGLTEINPDYVAQYGKPEGFVPETTVFFSIYINDKEVKHYSDPIAFLYFFQKNSETDYEYYNGNKYLSSSFFPFTCSCGISGCASIWDGIFVKWRKNTVEWRIRNREKNGYKFLEKSFYSFDRTQYEKISIDIFKFIKDKENKDAILEEHLELDGLIDWFRVNKDDQFIKLEKAEKIGFKNKKDL